MDKVEAISEIINAARSERMSLSELRRIRRVGKSLGLTESEQAGLERLLEYRDSEGQLREQWIK